MRRALLLATALLTACVSLPVTTTLREHGDCLSPPFPPAQIDAKASEVETFGEQSAQYGMESVRTETARFLDKLLRADAPGAKPARFRLVVNLLGDKSVTADVNLDLQIGEERWSGDGRGAADVGDRFHLGERHAYAVGLGIRAALQDIARDLRRGKKVSR